MTRQWLKFYRLPRQDKVLLCRAAGCLVVYVAALRLAGFRRSLALSRSLGGPPQDSPRDPGPGFPERARLALDRACRVLGIGTCLSRSLALRRLLASAGVDAVVRIGTRREDRRFAAHAWVEIGPKNAVLDSRAPAYRRFSARF